MTILCARIEATEPSLPLGAVSRLCWYCRTPPNAAAGEAASVSLLAVVAGQGGPDAEDDEVSPVNPILFKVDLTDLVFRRVDNLDQDGAVGGRGVVLPDSSLSLSLISLSLSSILALASDGACPVQRRQLELDGASLGVLVAAPNRGVAAACDARRFVVVDVETLEDMDEEDG